MLKHSDFVHENNCRASTVSCFVFRRPISAEWARWVERLSTSVECFVHNYLDRIGEPKSSHDAEDPPLEGPQPDQLDDFSHRKTRHDCRCLMVECPRVYVGRCRLCRQSVMSRYPAGFMRASRLFFREDLKGGTIQHGSAKSRRRAHVSFGFEFDTLSNDRMKFFSSNWFRKRSNYLKPILVFVGWKYFTPRMDCHQHMLGWNYFTVRTSPDHMLGWKPNIYRR